MLYIVMEHTMVYIAIRSHGAYIVNALHSQVVMSVS